MKPLKTLKAKKLTIQKETLRTLTNDDLARANGGIYYNPTGSAWCSSATNNKCLASGMSCAC